MDTKINPRPIITRIYVSRPEKVLIPLFLLSFFSSVLVDFIVSSLDVLLRTELRRDLWAPVVSFKVRFSLAYDDREIKS